MDIISRCSDFSSLGVSQRLVDTSRKRSEYGVDVPSYGKSVRIRDCQRQACPLASSLEPTGLVKDAVELNTHTGNEGFALRRLKTSLRRSAL